MRDPIFIKTKPAHKIDNLRQPEFSPDEADFPIAGRHSDLVKVGRQGGEMMR
jgi:hypothetical protein